MQVFYIEPRKEAEERRREDEKKVEKEDGYEYLLKTNC